MVPNHKNLTTKNSYANLTFMPLNPEEKPIIAWIERSYHESGRMPPLNQYIQNFPNFFSENDPKVWLDRPDILTALSNRGISPVEGLSEQQLAAILTVANLTMPGTTANKLKTIGVTTTQWNAWKRDPKFIKFLHSQLNHDFDTSLDRAYSGILRAVDKGDPRAVQLYMELTGRQTSEVERNYKMLVSKLIECVTRNVKDPAVLQRIAVEFQAIDAQAEHIAAQPLNLLESL